MSDPRPTTHVFIITPVVYTEHGTETLDPLDVVTTTWSAALDLAIARCGAPAPGSEHTIARLRSGDGDAVAFTFATRSAAYAFVRIARAEVL